MDTRMERIRAKKASPGGKLAPEATEGEMRTKRYGYLCGYSNLCLSSRIPLQPLRGSFPPGDAYISRIRVDLLSALVVVY